MAFPMIAAPLIKGKIMTFVDGENITSRYQSMKRNGWTPLPNVVHRENVFVWAPNSSFFLRGLDQLRVTYYTSIVSGDQQKINEVNEFIRKQSFALDEKSVTEYANHLTPFVVTKEKPEKSRYIDIKIAIDV